MIGLMNLMVRLRDYGSRMAKKVVPFRRLKHGAPVKLKVLVEDLAPRRRSALPFAVALALVSGAAFAIGYLAP